MSVDLDVAGNESFAELCALNGEALGPDCCLLAWRGSVAHGTYVPPEDPDAFDDRDLMGVVVPGERGLLGLSQFGSRGTAEVKHGEWDVVVYEHRKALRLLEKGNPNVLALLWLPEEMYVWRDTAGDLLVEHRELFSAKSSYNAFRGYAKSQLKKMSRGSAYAGYMGEKRKQLVDRFGYDVKNASHAIRILRQGVEFISTGRMRVDRSGWDAGELLQIKRGLWDAEAVVAEFEELDEALVRAYESSPLPERVDREQVDALAVEMGRARL